MAIKFDDDQLNTIYTRITQMTVFDTMENIITAAKDTSTNLEKSSEITPLLTNLQEKLTTIKSSFSGHFDELKAWLKQQLTEYTTSTEEAEAAITKALSYLEEWNNN